MFIYHTYISWTKTKLLKYYRSNMKGGYEIQQVDFTPSLILLVGLLKKFLNLIQGSTTIGFFSAFRVLFWFSPKETIDLFKNNKQTNKQNLSFINPSYVVIWEFLSWLSTEVLVNVFQFFTSSSPNLWTEWLISNKFDKVSKIMSFSKFCQHRQLAEDGDLICVLSLRIA